ncbi:outer membrane protein [Helicobacter pylori]|uniref:outer membrane protein n=1 Tax=Helicobacter pylori TaxID=210 RepID=UPI000D34C50B|nr:outer membrane protein [Helicobacter pylori]PUD31363.1 outer membrane protein [Helicobacter pylori]WQX34190.1 outer membrane protein [Helicobacter pylori]
MKKNHEKNPFTLSLSLSFWLHAERNGFYLGLNFLEGSYIKEQGSIGERILAENALNQAIKNANDYPFYKQLVKDVEDAQNAFNKVKDSNKVAIQLKGNGGTGGLLSEISFGYKYFLGKKRIIGFRHSLFFGYQFSGLALAPFVSLIAVSPLSLPIYSSIANSYSDIGSIAFLPYGFNTDLLINLIDDNERASQESGETLDSNALKKASRRRKYSLGLVIGMDIGASTWFASNNLNLFNQVKSRTIFQLQGKFGIRWNRDSVGIELGVKVPAFKVNYYSDNYGDKLDYKRVVSVYLNYTYNFKN